MLFLTSKSLICDPLTGNWELVAYSSQSRERQLWVSLTELPHAAFQLLSTSRLTHFRYASVILPYDNAEEAGEYNFTDEDGDRYSGAFTQVEVNGYGSYCEERISIGGDYYLWESDNSWHTEPEPEPEETYHLPDYHEQRPNWRTNSSGLLWGVELEVYCSSNESRNEMLEAFDSSIAVIERDGSLDDERGAEIVFAPVTFDKLASVEVFNKYLNRIYDYCNYRKQPSGYGMHLNVDFANFDSELHQLKFAHFLNEADAITCSIANRSSNSYAQKSSTPLTEKRRLGKYRFVCFHENRLEVRIFGASLLWARFRLQCDFAKSVVEYTRCAGITQLNQSYYLEWLRNTVGADYRNLRAYFAIATEQDAKLLAKESHNVAGLKAEYSEC